MGGGEEAEALWAAGREEVEQEEQGAGCVAGWGATPASQGGLGGEGGLPLHRSEVGEVVQTCRLLLSGFGAGEHLTQQCSTDRLQGSSSAWCG